MMLIVEYMNYQEGILLSVSVYPKSVCLLSSPLCYSLSYKIEMTLAKKET